MPIQDRRPTFGDGTPIGEGVKPDEVEEVEEESSEPEPAPETEAVEVEEEDDLPDFITPESLEGEGTPADPAENNDPDEEETAPVEAQPEEAEKKFESVESLEQRREKLLREITDLRGERRDLKGGPFKSNKDEPLLVTDPAEDDPLKDVNPQDRELIDKVVDFRLKSGGYLKKDELQTMTLKERVQAETESWIKDNSEFSKDNDPDDEKWNQVRSYVQRFFTAPSKPEDVREMLDIAQERLFGKKTAQLPTKSIKSVAAKKEKIAAGAKSSSGGGTSSGGSSKQQASRVDPSLMDHLQGFTDEEKKEFLAS
jgi:hypothetical protein